MSSFGPTTTGYEKRSAVSSDAVNGSIAINPKPLAASESWWAQPDLQADRVKFAERRVLEEPRMLGSRECRMVNSGWLNE